MKAIIAGSRSIADYALLKKVLDESHLNERIAEIVSGHAKGVDLLGERYAKELKLALKIMPADWESFGKGAGFRRNWAMAEYANALIALWDGKSPGTKHMIDTANKRGLKVCVYNKSTDKVSKNYD